MRRQAGTTLIEVVIAIVIISIAVSAVLMALTMTVGYSADPMIRHQAVAIAEAYLEEITLKAFVDPDGDVPMISPPVDELREQVSDPAPDIDLTDLITPVVTSLEEWRDGAARAAKVAPAAVLSDDALQGIAERRPASIDELADVPGVGPGKARRFGPRLLEIAAPID